MEWASGSSGEQLCSACINQLWVCQLLYESFYRRFQIINPTSTGYEFSWNNEGGLPSTVTSPPFKCLTPKGFVAGGKKYEVTSHSSEVRTKNTNL